MEARQPKLHLAVLDDDDAHLGLIDAVMQKHGYHVTCFASPFKFMQAVPKESFDMLFTDWHMPGMSGPDVVMWLREHVSKTMPVMMLTSRCDERDLVLALEYGADDFMAKPLEISELVARTNALLRRAFSPEQAVLHRHGNVEFNHERRTVSVNGAQVDLRGREYDLALILFTNIGRLMPRRRLLDSIWGYGSDISSRVLDTLVSRVRMKMNLRPDNGYRLDAIYSIGYRLVSRNG